MTATTRTWRRNDARQLMVVVTRPPMSGPAAAPIPAAPLTAPKARAREGRSVVMTVTRM